MYDKIYNLVSQQLLKPNLVIYLRAQISTLIKQIHQRGREYELRVSPSYLEELISLYNRYFSHYNATPLLVVDSSNFDFLHNQDDYNLLLEAIASAEDGIKYLKKPGSREL